MAKKRRQHNEKYFPNQNVPHGVIILAIIVQLGMKDVPTNRILRVWGGIVNMKDRYNTLTRYLYDLRKGAYIKTVRKKEGSYHSITKKGWKRLVYHYKKGNIPDWLLKGVETYYKKYDEHFTKIREIRKKNLEYLKRRYGL